MSVVHKLIDQAWSERQNTEGVFEPYFDAELFAQLLIKECMAQNKVAMDNLRKDEQILPATGIMFPIILMSCNEHLQKYFELNTK